eukprot:1351845-Pleurochrysis_carterae.AAC.1
MEKLANCKFQTEAKFCQAHAAHAREHAVRLGELLWSTLGKAVQELRTAEQRPRCAQDNGTAPNSTPAPAPPKPAVPFSDAPRPFAFSVSWGSARRVPPAAPGRPFQPENIIPPSPAPQMPTQTPSGRRPEAHATGRSVPPSTGSTFSSWQSVYGKSGISSFQERTQDEKEARNTTSPSLIGSKSLRPKHSDYSQKVLSEKDATSIITTEHGCAHKFKGPYGKMFECTHGLWATAVPEAVHVFHQQQERFL